LLHYAHWDCCSQRRPVASRQVKDCSFHQLYRHELCCTYGIKIRSFVDTFVYQQIYKLAI
jgi:hypothetical protein